MRPHIDVVRCPGCNIGVGPKRRQKHLSVCPKPSSNIERLRAFAGQVSSCRHCGRVLSDLFLGQHENQCKVLSENRAGLATGPRQSCPGCRTPIAMSDRALHLSVCPTPSDDPAALARFAGPVKRCAACRRLVGLQFYDGHMRSCPALSSTRPRLAEHRTPQRRRFDASIVCNLCNQKIGKHSVNYHLANECTKKPVLGPPQVTPNHAEKDDRVVGWWHGGE